MSSPPPPSPVRARTTARPPSPCTYRSVAEHRYDQTRLRTVAARVRTAIPRFHVDVDDAERWTDRWRMPVRITPGTPVTFDASHFAAVAVAGGTLRVEERFDTDQMNAYYVDVPRTRRGGWRAWWAWSNATRCTCTAAVAVVLVSAAVLVTRYGPYL